MAEIRKNDNGNHENVVTADGRAKLEAKLDNLKSVKRLEIAERIKQALAFGDISENSEYDEAKNEQAFVEGEIVQLENMLRTVRIIDEDSLNNDEVHIGNHIVLTDMQTKEKLEFTIVGSAEADPFFGTISNVSPVGNAVLGRKKGEVVIADAPQGTLKYRIESISR